MLRNVNAGIQVTHWAIRLIALLAVSCPVSADKLFVSNERDNTVTVIDAETYERLAEIKTGRRPRGIISSPDRSKVYVCAGDDDLVNVIDSGSLQITRSLPSGADPELLDIDPTGQRIYIANEDDALVTVMNEGDGDVLATIPVGVEPEGMRVHPANQVTVATSEETSMAHFINNNSVELVGNVLVDTRPRHAEYTRDGKQVWVSSEIGGTVTVIDVESRKKLHRIGFQIRGMKPELLQPVGIRMSKDGARAFVALGPANHVAVVNTTNYEIEKYILVGQRPWHMELHPDGTWLYVANGLSNDLTIIDVKALKAVRSVPVGRLPWGIAYAK